MISRKTTSTFIIETMERRRSGVVCTELIRIPSRRNSRSSPWAASAVDA
jgi:hypothetical protein